MRNREEILEAMKSTGRMPQEYLIPHKGTHACSVWSNYLFDLYLKIRDSATPDQKQKYKDLQAAYVDIVNDLSHAYRLEYLIDQYQMKYANILLENINLKKENEKLLKTIGFMEENEQQAK